MRGGNRRGHNGRRYEHNYTSSNAPQNSHETTVTDTFVRHYEVTTRSRLTTHTHGWERSVVVTRMTYNPKVLELKWFKPTAPHCWEKCPKPFLGSTHAM